MPIEFHTVQLRVDVSAVCLASNEPRSHPCRPLSPITLRCVTPSSLATLSLSAPSLPLSLSPSLPLSLPPSFPLSLSLSLARSLPLSASLDLFAATSTYFQASAGSSCSESGGAVIDSSEECLVAAAGLSHSTRDVNSGLDTDERPPGCFLHTALGTATQIEFNANLNSPDTGRWPDTSPICQRVGESLCPAIRTAACVLEIEMGAACCTPVVQQTAGGDGMVWYHHVGGGRLQRFN